MRSPAIVTPQEGGKGSVARPTTFPAPVGGLNGVSGIASVPITDAVRLDNLFPTEQDCVLRNGYAEHVTGLGGEAETLMTWIGATAEKLFAAYGDSIYEGTTAGAVGSAVVTGLTEDRWQWTNYSNAGGYYLYACNGADDPRHYNGTTWATPALSATVSADTFIDVMPFKERLFFLEKDALRVHYLAVGAIAGAVSVFNLSQIFDSGGYLIGMETWSRDTGNGPADFIVFATSNGEVAVYQGSDPSDANDWSIVGRYKIGKPLSRRSMIKYGADVLILTELGLVSLAAAAQRLDAVALGPAAKISKLLLDAVTAARNLQGWELSLFTAGRKLVINTPTSSTTRNQYVMNLQTGAWCRFTGIQARTFTVMSNDLYFSRGTGIWQGDTGLDDNGEMIVGDAIQAWSYFGSSGVRKSFKQVRPAIFSNGLMQVGVRMLIDFDENGEPVTVATSGSTGAYWDEFEWDTTLWGDTQIIFSQWRGVSGIGFVGALRLRISSDEADVNWKSTDFLYEYANDIA